MSDTASKLHAWGHDDYKEAKRQIIQAIGSIEDIDIWGRNVLVAVYVRPDRHTMKSGGIMYHTITEMKSDWWEGKVVMILKCGPQAFDGAPSYIEKTFGGPDKVPQPGDWIFANANAGIPISLCGDGASQVMGPDHRGELHPVYNWHGWPCRIISDDAFLGRIAKPTSLV